MPEIIQNGLNKVKQLSAACKDRFLSLERIVAALLTSLMFSYIYVLIGDGNYASYNEYYLNINYGAFFTIALLSFAAMIAATYLSRCRYIIPWALIASTVAVSVLVAANYPASEIVPGTSYYGDPEHWVSANISYVFFTVGVGIVDIDRRFGV